MSDHQDSRASTTLTLLNLTQAAEAVGVTRKTLYKHLNDGKLSATRDSTGKRSVDVSELIRVYGKVKLPESPVNAGKQVSSKRAEASEETMQALQGMRIELEKLRDLVQAQAEAQTQTQQLLLEDSKRREEREAEFTRLQTEADELRRQLEQERAKGFWARVFKG